MFVTARTARAGGAAALLAALSIGGLTACGGGSSGETAGNSPAATDGGAGTGAATAGSIGSTAPAGGGADADDLAKGLLAALNAVAKGDCSKAKTISDEFDGDLTGADLPDFEVLADGMQEVAAKGPSEIRADVKVMADAFSQIADVYAKLGLTDMSNMASIAGDPAKMAELERVGAAMEAPALQEASDRIDAWIDGKCPGLNDE